MSEKLSPKKRNENLNKLQGWKKTRGKDSIEKEFIFKDFQSAFAWMTRNGSSCRKDGPSSRMVQCI